MRFEPETRWLTVGASLSVGGDPSVRPGRPSRRLQDQAGRSGWHRRLRLPTGTRSSQETGVRSALGSFTVENDTEHMGCSERCRRQQQGTRVAARGSSVLRDASGVMSGVTPDLGRLETTGRSERSRCGLPIRNRVAGISIRRFYSTTRRMVTFSTRSSTRLRFDRPDEDPRIP